MIARALRRVALAALGALAGLAAGVVPAGAQTPAPLVAAPIEYSLASMPDFLNADIADLGGLPTFRPGMVDGSSPSWEHALGRILDAVRAEGVTDLLVAGDFVEGEWGRDDEATGVFGPVGTAAERRRAVANAGDAYYGAAVRRFAEHGLTLYPALGDHEIGDNPWGLRLGWYEAFKYRNVAVFKSVYSHHMMRGPDGRHRFTDRPPGPANGTAYAVRPHPRMQLVSLDVFRPGRRRGEAVMRLSVDPQQLRWLDRVLRRANRDRIPAIIVQLHLPILGPVSERYTSGMIYEHSYGSPLWRTLARHRVDLVLTGEAHDVTTLRRNGIVQITHGGLVMAGEANYIVVSLAGDRLVVHSRAFPGARLSKDRTRTLWQTALGNYRVPAEVAYDQDPVTTGEMVLDTRTRRLLLATGALAFDYVPPPPGPIVLEPFAPVAIPVAVPR